jgi:predicted nucleotidyltransferase
MASDSAAVRERIESLVAACRSVLQREGLQGAVFLYGSSLERDFRSDSDVDLAVLDDVRHPLSWSEQARLMDILERALGKGVDLRMLRETSPSHQAHVLEQGQLVWSQDPDLVKRYGQEIRSAIQSEREQAAREWPLVLDRLAGR